MEKWTAWKDGYKVGESADRKDTIKIGLEKGADLICLQILDDQPDIYISFDLIPNGKLEFYANNTDGLDVLIYNLKTEIDGYKDHEKD